MMKQRRKAAARVDGITYIHYIYSLPNCYRVLFGGEQLQSLSRYFRESASGPVRGNFP
jgi:hypothetical protein